MPAIAVPLLVALFILSFVASRLATDLRPTEIGVDGAVLEAFVSWTLAPVRPIGVAAVAGVPPPLCPSAFGRREV